MEVHIVVLQRTPFSAIISQVLYTQLEKYYRGPDLGDLNGGYDHANLDWNWFFKVSKLCFTGVSVHCSALFSFFSLPKMGCANHHLL